MKPPLILCTTQEFSLYTKILFRTDKEVSLYLYLKFPSNSLSKTQNLLIYSRYDQRRGSESSGTWLPYANAAQLQPRALRDHARMLAQRSDAPTNFRDAPMEARRFLHHGPKRLQRSTSPLISKRRRHLRHGSIGWR